MRIRFIRAGIISIVATVVLAVITLAIIGTSAFGDSADLSYRTLDYDVTAKGRKGLHLALDVVGAHGAVEKRDVVRER